MVGSAEAGWPWQQGQGTSAKKLTLGNYQVLNEAVEKVPAVSLLALVGVLAGK